MNLHYKHRTLNFKMRYTYKHYIFLKYLLKSGYVLSFFITYNRILNRKYINISLFYYKNFSFFKPIKLISKPSKHYFISLHSLKLVSKYLGASSLLLSTSNGYLNHQESIKLKKGGEMIALIG